MLILIMYAIYLAVSPIISESLAVLLPYIMTCVIIVGGISMAISSTTGTRPSNSIGNGIGNLIVRFIAFLGTQVFRFLGFIGRRIGALIPVVFVGIRNYLRTRGMGVFGSAILAGLGTAVTVVVII